MNTTDSIPDLIAWCNVTRQEFTPEQTRHGMAACIRCDAYMKTYSGDARPAIPQWHPLVSRAELAATLARQEAQR